MGIIQLHGGHGIHRCVGITHSLGNYPVARREMEVPRSVASTQVRGENGVTQLRGKYPGVLVKWNFQLRGNYPVAWESPTCAGITQLGRGNGITQLRGGNGITQLRGNYLGALGKWNLKEHGDRSTPELRVYQHRVDLAG